MDGLWEASNSWPSLRLAIFVTIFFIWARDAIKVSTKQLRLGICSNVNASKTKEIFFTKIPCS